MVSASLIVVEGRWRWRCGVRSIGLDLKVVLRFEEDEEEESELLSWISWTMDEEEEDDEVVEDGEDVAVIGGDLLC